MKARDIIAGWPRGRSNSEPFDCDSGIRFLVRDAAYISAATREMAANHTYHERQQRMVDEFRRERVKPETDQRFRPIVGCKLEAQ